MLSISPSIRIFVHALPTDMRKSFDGLYAIVAQAFGKDVLGGDYFVGDFSAKTIETVFSYLGITSEARLHATGCKKL
jgi:hypothetical protein